MCTLAVDTKQLVIIGLNYPNSDHFHLMSYLRSNNWLLLWCLKFMARVSSKNDAPPGAPAPTHHTKITLHLYCCTSTKMSAATILSQAYGPSACLYTTVLCVPRDATPSQLRKAYYKKALQLHPDKLDPNLSPDQKEEAKLKFQAISLAYTILSDEEKRAEYDENGELYEDDDDMNTSGVDQWTSYFKNIFPTVTTADIDAFEVKYKCSEEEESDVLKYYTQFKGDLNKMIECVMLSTEADKERWVKDYIMPAVEAGNVRDYSDRLKKTMGSADKKTKKRGVGKSKSNFEEVEDMSDSDDAPCAEIVDDEMEDVTHNDNNARRKSKSSSSAKTSPKKKTATKKAAPPAKKNSQDDLIAAIRGKAVARRQEGFDSMMAGLEQRYGGANKKNGKKTKSRHEDIDDEEFEMIQAKMMKNRKK
jgi:DnaJ family protein C protein 9